MKKIFYLMGFVLAMLHPGRSAAQEGIFNHVSVGAEVGLTGWGFEVSAPLTHYVTSRKPYAGLRAP